MPTKTLTKLKRKSPAAPALNARHARILSELLTLPTAPFAEHVVASYIERFCSERSALTLTNDLAGNLLVRLRVGQRRVPRPVCLCAHLDHPGFVADRMISPKTVRAYWRGGVAPEYFVGSRLRFYVDGIWHRGEITAIDTVTHNDRVHVDTVTARVRAEIPQGAIGMWDFPDPQVRGGRVYARGCDDVAGAAAILCCIDDLIRDAEPCDAYFLFTRAEEVGYVGAIAATRLKTIPDKCIIVAMETSSERTNARMGDGPILRVGDRSTTFTHAVTAYCNRVAKDLASRDSSFQFQRKLMDGGTCESSAYCTLGYEATGICVALGNYHNVDRKRNKIAAEYIDLGDYANVVKWFVALSRAAQPYTGRDEAMEAELRDLERQWARLLAASKERPC